MHRHPEPFATPGAKGRSCNRVQLRWQDKGAGKTCMRGRYASAAASQAWCNTSGCASAKPCQHLSLAGPQPRLCRERAAPSTAAVPGPLPQPPSGAIPGTGACIGRPRLCRGWRKLLGFHNTALGRGYGWLGKASCLLAKGVGERGMGVGCPARRWPWWQGWLGLSHPFCRCLLPPCSVGPKVWLALSPHSPRWTARLGALSCFFARMGIGKPEGSFPAGAKMGANSKRETVDCEPYGPSSPMGVLSPWAGHPTHIPRGPPWMHPHCSGAT